MKKSLLWQVPLASLIYMVLLMACSATGLIHPYCYAYVGTFFPIFFSFIYFFISSRWQCFGAGLTLNCLLLVILIVFGEGGNELVIGLIVLGLISEVIRFLVGYTSKKGIIFSFIPLAYSFYAYSIHWWTNTAESLEEAVEEMRAGYDAQMALVIQNTPLLFVMLILVIPVAILSIILVPKILKKSAEKLESN